MQASNPSGSLWDKINKLTNYRIAKVLNNDYFFASNVMKCYEMLCFYRQFFYNVFWARPEQKFHF